jgi:hypothetical protein
LLPYLEQEGLYRLNCNSHHVAIRSQPVPLFRCPADPTGPTTDWAPGNINANARVFGIAPGGTMSLSKVCRGGSSALVFLAERYNVCQRTGVSPGEGRWAYRDDQPHGMAFSSTGPFQVRPDPVTECRYDRPQSGHLDGMNVGLGDGSVRFCAEGISPATWARVVQPTEEAPLPGDWCH